MKNGRAIVIPISAETIGHGTHTKAALWKQHLDALLKQTEMTLVPPVYLTASPRRLRLRCAIRSALDGPRRPFAALPRGVVMKVDTLASIGPGPFTPWAAPCADTADHLGDPRVLPGTHSDQLDGRSVLMIADRRIGTRSRSVRAASAMVRSRAACSGVKPWLSCASSFAPCWTRV